MILRDRSCSRGTPSSTLEQGWAGRTGRVTVHGDYTSHVRTTVTSGTRRLRDPELGEENCCTPVAVDGRLWGSRCQG